MPKKKNETRWKDQRGRNKEGVGGVTKGKKNAGLVHQRAKPARWTLHDERREGVKIC